MGKYGHAGVGSLLGSGVARILGKTQTANQSSSTLSLVIHSAAVTKPVASVALAPEMFAATFGASGEDCGTAWA